MNLNDKIDSDLKDALKNQDKVRLDTLRMLRSAIVRKEKEVSGQTIDDSVITKIIASEIKSREESAKIYKDEARPELADKENQEVEILKNYQPKQLSSGELDKLIDDTIQSLGAKTPADMGKVMGKLMPEIAGKADGGYVSQKVREKLSKAV